MSNNPNITTQPIKLLQSGGKTMMQFTNCTIDFPQSNGLYFVSSGCGSGKTTIIAEIIKQYHNLGILVIVPTIEAAEELRPKLQIGINYCILHSGDMSMNRLQDYRNDPHSLSSFDVLVITSARLQLDPLPLFTSYNNGYRGLVLLDELINFYPEPPITPKELKPVLTYIDNVPDHNGVQGVLVDDKNTLYQHIYQDKKMMMAAYKSSGLDLMKLTNNLEKYRLKYLFSQISGSNSFNPAKFSLASLAAGSRVILFDGTIDCLTSPNDNRILPITGPRYNSDITFTDYPLPFKRRGLSKWDETEVKPYLKGLVDIVRKETASGRVLIVTWMSLYVDQKSVDDLENEKKPTDDFCKLLTDHLISEGIDWAKFKVIYRGSGNDRGSNEFRDYSSIIFFGEWHIMGDIVGDINHMFGLSCSYDDYMTALMIQTICRLRIRHHHGLPIKVFYSDDIRQDRMYKVQQYFKANSPLTCNISGVAKPVMPLSKPDKKKLFELIALYSYDNKIQAAVEKNENLPYQFSISLDDLFKLIPRDRKNKSRYDSLVEFLSNNYQITMTIT